MRTIAVCACSLFEGVRQPGRHGHAIPVKSVSDDEMQMLTAFGVAGCCISCLLRAGANNGVAAAAGQVDFSPAFIWLLRDFQLRLEAEGKPITPAEYLEEALLPIKGGATDIANKNQV